MIHREQDVLSWKLGSLFFMKNNSTMINTVTDPFPHDFTHRLVIHHFSTVSFTKVGPALINWLITTVFL